MQVKILKGTNEIGGNTVILKTSNSTILIDYGLPLSNESKQIEIKEKIDAVLISHPHLDHYGEIEKINSSIPIYCGKLTKELINASRVFNKKTILKNKFINFEQEVNFNIGDFKITPFLVDHSAVDSYAFLIEANGKKVLYSGDFRNNGRKKKLFFKMINDKKIKNVDVLIMEGTMIKRDDKIFKDEIEVENKIYNILKNSKNISFLISSSQNIDRIVSAFRACLRANKIFVIDIYSAWILEKIKLVSKNTPNINWQNIKVYKPTINSGGVQYGVIKENKEFFDNFRFKIFNKNNIIDFETISKDSSKYLIKCSSWYIENILRQINQKEANIIYSLWNGYLSKEYSSEKTVKLYENLKQNYNFFYVHTGGHANLDALKQFASSINAKNIIPIHTEEKKEFKKHFKNVKILEDSEVFEIGG